MNQLFFRLVVIVALVGAGTDWVQAANSLGRSIEVQAGAVADAAASQARIDQTHEQTRSLLDEYRQVTRELESLRRYDDHLMRMIQGQESAVARLQLQLEEVAVTHREVVPLMARMVESLNRFIELDLPFQLEERRGRAALLGGLVDAPDISLAEKYRRILEAYRIEAEYGRTVEGYRGPLSIAGTERTVEFLRLGRVVFIYRSLDGSEAAVWNPAAAAWTGLSDEYRRALGKAFRVARKQAAPDLLQLPVPAPGPES